MSNKLGIYVDLDSLLDNRLSLLNLIDKRLTDFVFKDIISYKNRIYDNFYYLDNKTFKHIYDRRDIELIKFPIPTRINEIIKSYLSTSMFEAKQIGEKEKITLYINIFPYKLSARDKVNIYRTYLSIFKDYIEVEILDYSFKDLSISFIDEHISLMIMYNGIEFLDYKLSNNELKNQMIPDVSMLVPKIFLGKNLIKKTEIDKFFENIEKLYSYYINLKFINTEMFSINAKLEKKK